MASMSETLTQKRGGIPTWGWFAIGVGALAVYMFLRARSQSQQQAASGPAALQTNVLSPGVAASLSQGAAPMGYSGGNIYNNVAVSGAATGAAPASNPDLMVATPGSTSAVAYRTAAGDTLASIAQKYGVPLDNLIAFNNNPGYRGSWGPLNTSTPNAPLAAGPGSPVVLVPWFNVDQSNFNGIRQAQGLPVSTNGLQP